ncbi:AAA family ATPase [Blastococcus sp. TBT05-19]|uniref:AAA family ATPase n=1 Tax=Blastococcus sp. TBT05-19 TaxID=2250581 RepID=UPI001F19D110|nr:AAA family ATPase [Blastococcus sp. TBT05-19]
MQSGGTLIRPGGPVLVVIGGLPGSGKTTLLRRILGEGVPGVVGLDSEQVTERVRRAGGSIPYGLLRPLVHGWHRWRVLRAVGGSAPVVLLTDPWTRPAWRAVVLAAARGAGRSVEVVLLDAAPGTARAGQLARDRTISARAFDRHVARWQRLLASQRDAVVLDRAAADRLSLGDLVPCPVSAPGAR